MTTYLIPCGRSAVTNLAEAQDLPTDVDSFNLTDALDEVRRWVDQASLHAIPSELILDRFWPEYTQVARRLALHRLGPAFSAETSTLAARVGVDTVARLLDDGHRVVLLSSQTPDGLLAALLVAIFVCGAQDRERVVVATTPAQLPAPTEAIPRITLLRGMVTVLRVSHLAPGEHDGFIRATYGIGVAMAAALDLGEPVDVHLSGGFKATLLQTLALAEIMYSLGSLRGVDVTAWYLFEEASADSRLLTPIGLRRFDEGSLRAMAEELTAVYMDGNEPFCPILEGVGWTRRANEKPALTAFGAGYQALLAHWAESTGGQRHGE